MNVSAINVNTKQNQRERVKTKTLSSQLLSNLNIATGSFYKSEGLQKKDVSFKARSFRDSSGGVGLIVREETVELAKKFVSKTGKELENALDALKEKIKQKKLNELKNVPLSKQYSDIEGPMDNEDLRGAAAIFSLGGSEVTNALIKGVGLGMRHLFGYSGAAEEHASNEISNLRFIIKELKLGNNGEYVKD